MAQGTALELKRRYGAGFTLTVINYSTIDCERFTREFLIYVDRELNERISPDIYDEHIHMIDKSGAVAVYSFKNEMEEQLMKTIRYLENLIQQ